MILDSNLCTLLTILINYCRKALLDGNLMKAQVGGIHERRVATMLLKSHQNGMRSGITSAASDVKTKRYGIEHKENFSGEGDEYIYHSKDTPSIRTEELDKVPALATNQVNFHGIVPERDAQFSLQYNNME
uniref:Uncharacterized protein n=1 Tax=Cannabis sativa TaxID=3483 RepID=A0A803NWF4_CANSA